jgi:hypothetical protein
MNSFVIQIAKDLLELQKKRRISSARSSIYAPIVETTSKHSFLNDIETAILRSDSPISLKETEELSVLGQRGIWANKSEVVNWKGVIPISEYLINEDANPEILNKRVKQQLEYVQELAIRYLRPPTPPVPGEIVITQEPNILTPPAPPLVIRQQPPRPSTPEPLIIREAPPRPPTPVGVKLITISGKRLPPPPRKVIIERLAPLPIKPQSVIIERWLPYNDNLKRRVVYQRPPPDPVVIKPRNVIIQWEIPKVSIRKDYKYLGVVRANPVEYARKYSSQLKSFEELPEIVKDIKNPEGIVLAADYKYNALHELEGDVDALKLIDLDRQGLSEYKSYLESIFVSAANQRPSVTSVMTNSTTLDVDQSMSKSNFEQLNTIDTATFISMLNSRLGVSYSDD